MRITRMGSGGGEGSFEIDHDQIGRIEAGLHETELSEEIVRSVRPPCRGQLRQMGHHVAREEQARTENAFVGRNRRRNDTLHPHAAQIPCADDDRSDHRQQYGTGTQPLHRPPRRFFFSRFGNQPFAVSGVAALAASLWVENLILSILLAVLGASSLWGIGELFEQRERVAKGWFPKREKKNRRGGR